MCVCAIHQNIVLLFDAIDKKHNELLQHLICNTENKICIRVLRILANFEWTLAWVKLVCEMGQLKLV